MTAYTHDCSKEGHKLIDSGVTHLHNRAYDHNDITGFNQIGVTGKGVSTQIGIEKNGGLDGPGF